MLEETAKDIPVVSKKRKKTVAVAVGRKRKADEAAVVAEEDSTHQKRKVQSKRKETTVVEAETVRPIGTVSPSTSSWTVVDIAEENKRDREMYPASETPILKKKKKPTKGKVTEIFR